MDRTTLLEGLIEPPRVLRVGGVPYLLLLRPDEDGGEEILVSAFPLASDIVANLPEKLASYLFNHGMLFMVASRDRVGALAAVALPAGQLPEWVGREYVFAALDAAGCAAAADAAFLAGVVTVVAERDGWAVWHGWGPLQMVLALNETLAGAKDSPTGEA